MKIIARPLELLFLGAWVASYLMIPVDSSLWEISAYLLFALGFLSLYYGLKDRIREGG